MNEDGLPTDFDININVPTLTLQINKVPVSAYVLITIIHHVEKITRDGLTYL